MTRRGESPTLWIGATSGVIVAVFLLLLAARASISSADVIGDPLPNPTRVWGAVAEDFDGINGPDVALSRHTGPADEPDGVYFADADGIWRLGFIFPNADRHGCDAGDVDGDGRPDLYCELGAHRGTGTKQNELWLQQPDGSFVDRAAAWGVEDPYGRGRRPLLYDHNGDGRLDLYITVWGTREDSNPNVNRLFINRGTWYRERTTAATGWQPGARCVTSGDFNADGRLDLIVCGNVPGTSTTLRIFRSTGFGHKDVSHFAGSPIGFPKDAHLADLDGDGLEDLVVVRKTSLQIRLNAGAGKRFGTVTAEMPLISGERALVEDLTGDGTLDIYVTEGCDDAGANVPDSLVVGTGSGWTRVALENEPTDGCTSEAIDAGKLIVFHGQQDLWGPVVIRDLPLAAG